MYLCMHVIGSADKQCITCYEHNTKHKCFNWCCQTINRIQNKSFVYIIYVCVLCIFIMCIYTHTHSIYLENTNVFIRALKCDPNFSMVRLKKNLSHSRKKKIVRNSESLRVVQQQTHIRLMSWSKPIRDSEGWTTALIGRGPDIRVSLKMCVLLQSDRERGEY